VELRDDERPHWSAKAYENCKLQYHYVDDACIAYAQPEVAKELIMMTPALRSDEAVPARDESRRVAESVER
jgi:hypothetical protein